MNKPFYSISTFKRSADKFNTISGSAQKTSAVDIMNQIKLMQEETEETTEAYKLGDMTGVLDGCIDVLYVTLGLLQKLQNAGVDTTGAMKQVAEDNLKKFPKRFKDACSSVLMYNATNDVVKEHYNKEYNVYVLKDQNDKVRKPLGFVGTDLSKYVPDNLVNHLI